MRGRIPLEHSFSTKRSSLTDGNGYVNSLTLNLNEQSQASTITPIPTPNPNATLPNATVISDTKAADVDPKADDNKNATTDKIYLNNISLIFALILQFILF